MNHRFLSFTRHSINGISSIKYNLAEDPTFVSQDNYKGSDGADISFLSWYFKNDAVGPHTVALWRIKHKTK